MVSLQIKREIIKSTNTVFIGSLFTLITFLMTFSTIFTILPSNTHMANYFRCQKAKNNNTE